MPPSPALLSSLAVLALIAVPAVALGAPAASAASAASAERTAYRSSGGVAAAPTAFPAVKVEVVASGLTLPWDLLFTPGGMIVTQRGGPMKFKPDGKPIRTIQASLSNADFGRGPELLGGTVDPNFVSNRLFYTCQLFKGSSTEPADVRVVRWKLSADNSKATKQGSPVVKGIPLGTDHVGCRVRFGAKGFLQVATGDAQVGTNPQSLQSLGGKLLRLRADGTIPTDNPYYAMGGNARYVWTYGHRNPQGLRMRPGTTQMWNSEHGPDRDDEINVNVKGGNFGWDPVPGYNQNVPMTNLAKYPDAVAARWSSGFPSIAPAGIEFLNSTIWGSWQNSLVMATLKDTGVNVYVVTGTNAVTAQGQIPELDGTYGRLRTVELGPNGALYVTTSNGSGTDKVLRVTPR